MTRELRTILKDVLYQEMEQLEERLNDLEPKDRMHIILKLMPYVFPKVIDVQSTKDEPLDLVTEFINLMKNLYMKYIIQFVFVLCSFVMFSQKSYNLPSGFSVYKDYDGNRVKVDHDFDADGISDFAILCNSEKHGPSMVVILSKKYFDQNTFYYFSWDAIATSMKVDSNNVLNISAGFDNGRYSTGIQLRYNRNIDNMRLIGLDASYLGDAYNMNDGGYDLSINLLTGECEYNGISKKKEFELITLSNIDSYLLGILPTEIPSMIFGD